MPEGVVTLPRAPHDEPHEALVAARAHLMAAVPETTRGPTTATPHDPTTTTPHSPRTTTPHSPTTTTPHSPTTATPYSPTTATRHGTAVAVRCVLVAASGKTDPREWWLGWTSGR